MAECAKVDQKIVSSKVHRKNPKTEIRRLDYCQSLGVSGSDCGNDEPTVRLVSKIILYNKYLIIYKTVAKSN